MFRLLALALGLGLLAQTGLPITEYTCRYTGKRLERCCCTGATRSDAPTLSRESCCDVSVTSSDRMLSASDAASGKVTPPSSTPIIVSTVVGLVAPVVVDVRPREVTRLERPHDTGPPRYLLSRHLLI